MHRKSRTTFPSNHSMRRVFEEDYRVATLWKARSILAVLGPRAFSRARAVYTRFRFEESYAAPVGKEAGYRISAVCTYTPAEGPGQRVEDISRCRPTYHSFAAWRAADTARQQHSQIKESQSPRRRGVGMALSRFIKLR